MTELSVAVVCIDADESPGGSGYAAALCCALACQFAGFEHISVYHTVGHPTDRPPPASPSTTLSPNASRVLRTLKALEPLRPFAFEPQFIHQRSHRSGFQLATLALGAMAEGRYGAPFLHVQQDHLCHELEQLAVARGISLQQVVAIDDLSQSATAVTLGWASTEHQHDVLIVAGDAHNQLRALAGAETLQISPTTATHWQGCIATDALPEGAFGPVLTQWLGPDHHLSYHFGAGAEHLHINAITAGQNTEMGDAFSLWHPSINALLAATGNFSATPLHTTASPERLAQGRIVFLGSSCHPIAPQLPQQTALGIEDAWVAARMLEQWEEDPARGWVEYEKYRLPRARRVQTHAARSAENLSMRAPAAIWRRNLALTFGSRFLPELAMQKNDWLFGYDAVNGFE